MKTIEKKQIYKIDSCLEKIELKTDNVCNRPNYQTICYKPIVDRNLLTRSDYLNMLSTPKGFKWIGIKSYNNKDYKYNWPDKNYDQRKR